MPKLQDGNLQYLFDDLLTEYQQRFDKFQKIASETKS